TFSDGKPAASESPELNPEDLTARLEDVKEKIDKYKTSMRIAQQMKNAII
ncbi:hypothetical protein Tco_0618969, partial [Tanacetum coccineum]